MIKNIVSNYIGKVWGILSVYVFIPLYIKFLGVEAYGIINFYTVLLSVLLFADAGLSATLSREFARSEDKVYCRNLLHSIERLYLVISLLLMIGVFLFAPQIAENWLNTDAIPREKITMCLRLMGIGIAFQFFSTLHNSGLLGLQKQVLANTIQVSWSAFRSGFVVVVLYFAPDLLTFFYWQIISNILFFIIYRYQLWKQISFNSKPIFDKEILKNISRFALGMMVMAIIASLNTQLDKLVVSKYLSLKQFSYYSLAATLSQIPMVFVTPLTIAVLPVIIKATNINPKDELIKVFHQYSFVVSGLSSMMGFIIVFYAKDIAYQWTHDEEISINIENVTQVLTVGGIFLCCQYMPYQLAIANGHTKSNLILGLIGIVLIVPLLYFFITTFGFVGAAYPWLILNILAFVSLGASIIHKFIKGEFLNWLTKGTLLPLLINFSLILLFFMLFSNFNGGLRLIIAIPISVLTCLGVNFLLFNKLFPNSYIYISIHKFLKLN